MANKYITISGGAFDLDSNGMLRRLGKCSLTGNRNYKEIVSIDVSNANYFPYQYFRYYDPTSKDLHKYRLLKGELRDEEIYGKVINGTRKIYYDSALKEEVSLATTYDGEPLIESVDYNVAFSPYDNSKIGEVDWIDESEGTFYYKPLKDGDAFKYAAIPIDDENEDIPIFYFYLVKKYSEKVYDVGDCFSTEYAEGSVLYNIRKYKLLRDEITDIELFEVPIIARKTIVTNEARITKTYSNAIVISGGENYISFRFLCPKSVSGCFDIQFSLRGEGEKISEYDCSYSGYDDISSSQEFFIPQDVSIEFESVR